jgi:glycosyltransferase involved in cell wall biosynthesis
MRKENKLLVYIPALNEESHIDHVIRQIPKSIEGIHSVDCLVVDDGSSDNTAAVAVSAGAHVVSHGRNQGVGMAFQSAVQYAWENDYDLLVGIDADGQFDPAEIPMLIQPLLDNRADMVVGNRFTQGRPEYMPPIKFRGNKMVAALVSSISGQKFQDVSCGFRAYNREALLRLNVFEKFTYTHESILSLVYQGLRVMEMPISIRYFPERKSRVAGSISNYASKTSKIILRVLLDYRPLRVFGMLGSIFFIIGLAFEIFLFAFYMINGSFTPYKSAGFIGLGFIIFGMLIFLVALIAEMINRLRQSQDRLMVELKRRRFK